MWRERCEYRVWTKLGGKPGVEYCMSPLRTGHGWVWSKVEEDGSKGCEKCIPQDHERSSEEWHAHRARRAQAYALAG